MYIKTASFALLASTLSVSALSSGCTTSVAGLALGDLGSCLQLLSALNVIQGSGNFTQELGSYLSSLCGSSTPTCSNSTLQSALSTVNSSCASDLQAGGSDAATVVTLQSVLMDYPEVRAGACSMNSTTNEYCIVNTIGTVQNITGQDISIDFLTGLLSGSGSDSLQSALQTGQLCTGCVGELYYQALQANQSIASSSIGQAITNQCGANFGTSQPSGVATPSSQTSGSAASSSAASGNTNAASSLLVGTSFVPYVFTAVALMAGLAAGGAAVL